MSSAMTTARFSSRARHIFALSSLAALTVVGVGCGSNGAQSGPGGGPAGGAPPPMPVEMVTLTQKPVEQMSEFVASLKSRRSTTIQPEVEGFVTRIAVRSGQQVARGAL